MVKHIHQLAIEAYRKVENRTRSRMDGIQFHAQSHFSIKSLNSRLNKQPNETVERVKSNCKKSIRKGKKTSPCEREIERGKGILWCVRVCAP